MVERYYFILVHVHVHVYKKKYEWSSEVKPKVKALQQFKVNPIMKNDFYIYLDFFSQVFEAEKMTGKFGYYHKKCFKCLKCKRPLDYQSLSEGDKHNMF